MRGPVGVAASSTGSITRDAPAVGGGEVRLDVPSNSFVVVAGLPGAGKTTLLRRLRASWGVTGLDPEDVAEALHCLRLPYGVLRPLVHVTHLARVLVALGSAAPCVLTSDPMTSPVKRRLLPLAARATSRRFEVVLIDVTPAEARDGQRRRGRSLSNRRMARHERRSHDLSKGGLDSAIALRLTRRQAASLSEVTLAIEP